MLESTFKSATIEFLTRLSEKDLQAKVVEPLLRKMGYTHVRDVSGPNEAGKDLVAIKNEFGKSKLYAIQIKRFVFSGKIGSSRSMQRVLDQLSQMMTEPTIDPTNNLRRPPDRGFFITPFQINRHVFEAALQKVSELERREMTLIDGPLLADQVISHLADLLLSESTELQYRYMIAKASDRVRESSAFGLGEDLSLDAVFVEVGIAYGLAHFGAIPRRSRDLPGRKLLDGNETTAKLLTSQWRHWTRDRPRIRYSVQRQSGASSNLLEVDLDPVLRGLQGKVSALTRELEVASRSGNAEELNRAVQKGVELRHRAHQLVSIPGLPENWPILNLNRGLHDSKFVGHTPVRSLLTVRCPVFLTGGPGAGKTTILRRLCQLTARETSDIPILIYLTRVQDISSLTSTCFSELRSLGYNISSSKFRSFLRAGKIRLLLDGLDEVGATGLELMKAIIEFSSQNRRCKIIVSCRDAFPYPVWDRAIHLHVPPFDDEKIGRFVANWFDSQPTAAAGVRAWLRKNPQMRGAARTPVMLALLCSLYHAEADLPTSEVELYEGHFDLLLGRWEKAKGAVPLPPDQRKRYYHFLMNLATEMHISERRTSSQDESEKVARDFISRSFNGSTGGLVQDCVQRGLLFREEDGGLSCGHLTYQEFLVGRRLALDSPTSLILGKLKDPWWSKALQFYASIMGDISLLLNHSEEQVGDRDRGSLETLAFLADLAPLTRGDARRTLRGRLEDL